LCKKGYGNLTPKTPMGKLATVFYALLGIPLMLLYMTNVGEILASSFKYTYNKMCR
jgi:potassium channel subfamily K member 18